MSEAIIEIEQVVFSYVREEGGENIPALDGVDLEILEGSFVAVIGPNGSGKSTLAKCFNALLLPEKGRVRVRGMDTGDDERVWDIRKTVGMVFQNPDNQLVSSIVEDDVAFGPENLGVEPAEIRERVDAALRSVDMYEHRKKGPHLLSGGQKQRIAIAGVLAMESECIVLDEPTAMLDPSGRREVMEIIRRLHARGKTIVLITHFMEEAAQADRIVVMEKGRIAFDGTPGELFTHSGDLRDLDMPFAVQLAARLRKRGIDVPKDAISEMDLVEFLCASK
jgi:energy-coupling factor transport system ATP-binding protein